MPEIILFNKPFGVVSQFTPVDGHPSLAEHINCKGFYPAGRLDRDSEGLLLLTNDGQLGMIMGFEIIMLILEDGIILTHIPNVILRCLHIIML